MKILKTSLIYPDKLIIDKAVQVLNEGGLVIYPTDTSYGLGGNALKEEVIQKIYEVKNRDFSKPTHAVVKDWEMISRLTKTNAAAKKLYYQFLPGPLTIILNKKAVVPDILTGGLKTLGIRIPDCEITRQISRIVNFPYTTTSANLSGGKTPYSLEDIRKALNIGKVDLIIDAGKLAENKPSTIIDLTRRPYRILREGPISKEKIDNILSAEKIEYNSA